MTELLDVLLTRHSVAPEMLSAPAPDAAQLEVILTAASRVSDHARTMPFYFLVFEGEARRSAGEKIAAVFQQKNPDASAEDIEAEAQSFMRSPMVIAVIYRTRRAKFLLWEQMMSVGAACQNLLIAAYAQGFAGQWLSEWSAYDEDVHAALGLDERDTVAGFMHLGTPQGRPDERERPDLAEIVTHWQDGAPIKKGDCYDRPKFDFPPLGFKG